MTVSKRDGPEKFYYNKPLAFDLGRIVRFSPPRKLMLE